ncbi:MAG TPA: hypothetical protein VE690_04725 [Rhodopila sp.]|jgi:hypothetical protein|nr:hypothetical protein [Rhodopila sp.]
MNVQRNAMFDLTDVSYIKRIVVGSRDPESLRSEDEIQAAMDLLNRCLTEIPRGRIIGVEKTFSLLNIGEHQVVLQCMIYHIGFSRRPSWMQD